MVDLARYFLAFTQDESCGKCVPCRIGTKRMLEIVTRICEGHGAPDDLETLEHLARDISRSSLCGLGQTAPNPVLTTLRYFHEELVEHIAEKKCRAGQCKALAHYVVIPENCRGCGVCRRVCPVDAIAGETKQIHHIDPEICIKCGQCELRCPFQAITHV
jgi:NAD-dependent dihydropyrimidine dehydrogenase PreA subunit